MSYRITVRYSRNSAILIIVIIIVYLRIIVIIIGGCFGKMAGVVIRLRVNSVSIFSNSVESWLIIIDLIDLALIVFTAVRYLGKYRENIAVIEGWYFGELVR